MPIAALPELKASLALSLVRPGRRLVRDDEQPDEVVRQVRRRTVGDDVQRVADRRSWSPSRGARRSWSGSGPSASACASIENFTSSAVKSEPSWNFTPRRSLNSQVGRIDRLPAFGEARLDLQPVAGPDQRVEHVLERLGMRAGRGEMRVDRVRPAAHADGQRLRETECRGGRQHSGSDQQASGCARHGMVSRMVFGRAKCRHHGRGIDRSNRWGSPSRACYSGATMGRI